ncbi:MAG: low temperature requirement protein A [Oscillospiraceae bacterium]|nr:low temperature requirement protein A [Oscillospiraceae bacterium]
MIRQTLEDREKKVEYIELIYDLIFVYIIGRNNSLLREFSGGFVTWEAFLAYVLTTLAVIQIWNYSTYYVNVYGRRSVREHVFLFINMFLLYFVGQSTRADWRAYHAQYHVAWALILANIGAQYLIEHVRHHRNGEPGRQSRRMMIILFAETALVLGDVLLFRKTGTTWLSLAAVLFGMTAVLTVGQRGSGSLVDFPHLSERAMLYVVFTFGEMIIAIASYFEDGFSPRGTYFALMAFLIVVGLFLSYGVFYDRIIDREKKTSGLGYMLLHIFLIFAMNNITSGLEFMREERIDLTPKVLFMIGSFLLFFGFLFALGSRHARVRCRNYGRLCAKAGMAGAAFAALMILLRTDMTANIALTAAFVFAMFEILRQYGKNVEEK